METEQTIIQFLELLDQSTLSEARKDYWFRQIESGHFNEEAFTQELDGQIARVDAAIAITEAEIADSEAKLAQTAEQALPYLQKLAEELPAAREEDLINHKKSLMQGEKEAIQGVEKVRGKSQTEEIAALRKKLQS